jgi:hypothetical protein
MGESVSERFRLLIDEARIQFLTNQQMVTVDGISVLQYEERDRVTKEILLGQFLEACEEDDHNIFDDDGWEVIKVRDGRFRYHKDRVIVEGEDPDFDRLVALAAQRDAIEEEMAELLGGMMGLFDRES